MMPADDAELLRRYVANGAEAAFAELVQRHLNLVFAAALRRVGGDVHLAQDVAQQVFTALARNAPALAQRPVLAGWLYTTTRFVAAQTVRGERRRHAREQEAYTMHELSSNPESHADWERLRPLLDGAMDSLSERDREAVLLRFFEGRSFANIGAALRLTEDAARMRVERALEKLHVTLARRGVKSTALALGMALTNYGSVAAPATFASSVTSIALAGAAGGTAATGWWAWMVGTKTIAGVGGAAAVLSGGIAVLEHRRAQDSENALAAAVQQQQASRAEIAAMAMRVAESDRRAMEAERDNGELLRAVEALRLQQTAQAARTANVAATGGRSAEEEERLAEERAFQQQLAKRRAEEAKARAKIESEAAAEKDAAARYQKLMETAEQYAANADFQAGIRTFNLAMQIKPSDLVVTNRIRELQTTLQAQNKPVEISLISDGVTLVSLSGPYGLRVPSPLQTAQVKVLPGNYEIVGRRKGYHDVVVPVQVRNGVPAPVISVICSTPKT